MSDPPPPAVEVQSNETTSTPSVLSKAESNMSGMSSVASEKTTTAHANTNSSKPSAPTTKNPRTAGIDKLTGYIEGEFDCVYNNVNGTLYAGNKALYFLGTYFLFDKKLLLKWQDIRQVQQSEQGIQILLNDDDAKVHVFSGMQNRPERVWVLLVSLHNDALLDRPARKHRAGVRQSLTASAVARRRNSDPLMNSIVHMFDDSIDDEDKRLAVDDYLQRKKQQELDASGEDDDPIPLGDSDMTADIVADGHATDGAGILLTNSFAHTLDMHSVAATTGKLSLQPVMCQYNKVPGKLYAGVDALYFFGRRFLWQQQELLLKWKDVRQIQIIDSTVGDTATTTTTQAASTSNKRIAVGLEVICKDSMSSSTDDHNRKHRFLGMENADKVWISLVQLHNNCLTARAAAKHSKKSLAAIGRSGGSLRRTNSDPAAIVAAGGPSRSILEAPIGEDEESSHHYDDDENEGGGATGDDQDWKEIMTSEGDYSKRVIQDYVLHNCTLDQFYETFLKQGADHSILKFLQSRGDFNLTESPWKKEKNEYSRFINYTHPVNAPMAPPSASARKEQTYRRYGDKGLSVCTKTFVDDVPMADCFYLSDRLRVESREKDVAVYLEFDITFVKSTMFKGIISKTSTSETTELFQAWIHFMSRAVGDEAAAAAAAPPPPVAVSKPAAGGAPALFAPLSGLFKQASTFWNVLTDGPPNIVAGRFLVMGFVFMQFWVILEVRGLKHELRDFKTALVHQQQ